MAKANSIKENTDGKTQDFTALTAELEDLSKAYASLNLEKGELDNKIIVLNASLEDFEELKKTYANLELENVALNDRIIILNSGLKERDTIIENLSEQLKGHIQGSIVIGGLPSSGTPIIPVDPIEVDGVMYVIQKPYLHHKGKTYTAEEAAMDINILNEVAAITGQTFLKQLV